MNEAIRQVTHVQNIRYDKATERLYIIDQTLLPNEEKEIELRTVEEIPVAVCDYIAGMTDHFAIEKYTEIFIPKFFMQK